MRESITYAAALCRYGAPLAPTCGYGTIVWPFFETRILRSELNSKTGYVRGQQQRRTYRPPQTSTTSSRSDAKTLLAK